jgi:hypothetical protein
VPLLKKWKLKVAAYYANDFQRAVFFAEVDDVASHVRRSNTFAKVVSIVTDVRMFRSQPTLLANLLNPLSCGKGLVIDDEACDLSKVIFDTAEYRSLSIT